MNEAEFQADGETTFDVAIIGAGVAGLCLAYLWHEANTPFRSILVIDGARDDDQLRTLSFWSPSRSVFEPLVQHAWKTLRLVDDGATHEVPIQGTTYRTLFWADLQRFVLDAIRRAPRCRVVDGRAADPVDHGDCVTVTVAGSTYRARWVMDSRFRLSDLCVDERRWHPLRQYFTGWIVRAASGPFDPSAATLFDFRTGLERGRSFFYVLPFSSTEALVELVTLDREDAAPVLDRYVREVLGLSAFEVVAREHGVNPMTEQPFESQPSPRVRRLGIAAGRLKPSTGYAFTRIEDDCRAIIATLESRGEPMIASRQSVLYRFLDGVMLELWDLWPERLPGIFRALFLKNPADRVLRFLDERAGFIDVVALIATLPFWPFIVAAFRWLTRRWLGWGAQTRSARGLHR